MCHVTTIMSHVTTTMCHVTITMHHVTTTMCHVTTRCVMWQSPHVMWQSPHVMWNAVWIPQAGLCFITRIFSLWGGEGGQGGQFSSRKIPAHTKWILVLFHTLDRIQIEFNVVLKYREVSKREQERQTSTTNQTQDQCLESTNHWATTPRQMSVPHSLSNGALYKHDRHIAIATHHY